MLSRRNLLAVLIVAATALFAIGVAIERSASHETHADTGSTAKPEDTEHGEGREESAHSEGAESTGHSEGETEEVFGIDAEATPFVVLAVLVSVALALAAWMRPTSSPILVVVALAMLAFAVFDMREVFHQVDESKTGLAVIAGSVAALHLAAAAVAGTMARRAGETPARSASEASATIAP